MLFPCAKDHETFFKHLHVINVHVTFSCILVKVGKYFNQKNANKTTTTTHKNKRKYFKNLNTIRFFFFVSFYSTAINYPYNRMLDCIYNVKLFNNGKLNCDQWIREYWNYKDDYIERKLLIYRSNNSNSKVART